MSAAGELAALARALLPPGLVCAVLPLAGSARPLLPAEAACVANAIPRRRHEFAIGRMALRQAIAAAGLALPEATPIPAAADRAPVLPDGIRASLSHSRALCIAVASRDTRLAPGVDIEMLDADLPRDLSAQRRPFRLGPGVDGHGGLLPFSMKEAIYKSQYPETGRFLDFPQAAVVLGPGRMRARLACGAFLSGRWGVAAGHLLVISFRARTDPPASGPSG